ncbi:hypothetical protein GGI18_003171, partial [Coemansia linderi]
NVNYEYNFIGYFDHYYSHHYQAYKQHVNYHNNYGNQRHSSKSKGSKPTGIPNISVVDKLPIPGKGDDDDNKEDSDESDTS